MFFAYAFVVGSLVMGLGFFIITFARCQVARANSDSKDRRVMASLAGEAAGWFAYCLLCGFVIWWISQGGGVDLFASDRSSSGPRHIPVIGFLLLCFLLLERVFHCSVLLAIDSKGSAQNWIRKGV